MLPREVDWVLGIKSLRHKDTCGVVSLRFGYDE